MREIRAVSPLWPHVLDAPCDGNCPRTPVVQPTLVTATKGFRHGYSPPLVNASTQMQQHQVAQMAQVLVLKKAMGIHQATGAMALSQVQPLATSVNLGTQVNAMA